MNSALHFSFFKLTQTLVLQELIEAAEKNAKGSIDQAEFMTLWVAFKAKVGEEGETEAEIKTAFKEYDLDGDGYITKDEMVEVRRENKSQLSWRFST